MTEKLLGSIEAGGTKFVCGVGTDDLTIVERVSFPTTTRRNNEKSNRIFPTISFKSDWDWFVWSD